MELKRVVVTGLGAVTPLGNNPEETWKAMLEGKSGAAPITYFDTTNFKAKFACEVKNLNVNDYIDRKEARSSTATHSWHSSVPFKVWKIAALTWRKPIKPYRVWFTELVLAVLKPLKKKSVITHFIRKTA